MSRLRVAFVALESDSRSDGFRCPNIYEALSEIKTDESKHIFTSNRISIGMSTSFSSGLLRTGLLEAVTNNFLRFMGGPLSVFL